MGSHLIVLNVESSDFVFADLIVLRSDNTSLFFFLPSSTHHLLPSALQQPFPHESLLMDRRELRLSRDEKRAARKGYEEEKRASVPYTRPSYAHYYPASDQSLTNIPAFSQRNWSVTHLTRSNTSGENKLFLPHVYSFVILMRDTCKSHNLFFLLFRPCL